MQKYIDQLLADLARATEDVPHPWADKMVEIHDWLPPDEDRRLAPKKMLYLWTGIKKEMLPPAPLLTDKQITGLLEALNKMLSAYNCHFCMQIHVPESIQYETIRAMWDQEHALMRWHYNFFEFCEEDQEHGTCTLGPEYCHCAFFEKLYSRFDDEEEWDEDDQRFWDEYERKKRERRDDWSYPYWDEDDT